jgi:beta-mannosidase
MNQPTPQTAPTAVLDLTSAAGAQWTVSAATPVPQEWSAVGAQAWPATIPGEVHCDLIAAGLVPDPFDGDNEDRLAWVGRTGWSYRTSFEWDGDAGGRHDLVAEGLDTVATLLLNGHEVARTQNQHRSYRFDVTEPLVTGRNELEVIFEAPVTAARRLSEELGERPRAYDHPFNAIRKMASGYGWDWGPDLAGVGIWKPIRIESWSTVRLAGVRPLARVEDGPTADGREGATGVLEMHLDLEWLPGADAPVTVEVRVGDVTATGSAAPGQPNVVVRAEVVDVQVWWPRGYGEQPLYPVTVRLQDDEETPAGAPGRDWQGRVGFRNVTLSTAPDRDGTEFVLAVNGRPVFVKGANWIPDDAFVTRLSRGTYESSITDAVDAGVNLLRVWGGGIYESSDFYGVCDEQGVLVWQDFLLACAAYSEDEPLWGEFEAEAREAVARLSQHASLALWNGGNENIWGFVEWGWRVPLAGRSWGDRYYTELFPAIVAELDPRTPYSAGSPYSFEKYVHPNDHRHGTVHEWEVWNRQDYRHYRDKTARFMSEFGFQGPPAWSTLTSVVHDEPLDPYGPQMLVHQKAHEGNLKLERGLGDHLPHWATEPEVDMADWHWVTQLNQARAVAYGIEHFRSHFPLNRGTVVWQLNDNWPVVSWAAVDGHGIRKPLWYALRRTYRSRFVTIQPRSEGSDGPGSPGGPDGSGDHRPTVFLHNDTDVAWEGELRLSRRATTGSDAVQAERSERFRLEPRAAVGIPVPAEVLAASSPEAEYVVADAGEAGEACWYFVEDTALVLADPGECLDVAAQRTDTGYDVEVSASALVKDLTLFPDRLDPAARVDSGLLTLHAGGSHTFRVTSEQSLDADALGSDPVLRSVNDLVAGSRRRAG